MNSKKGIYSTIIVVTIIIVGIALSGNKQAPKGITGEAINIGVVAPLTGDAAIYGISLLESVQLAVDTVNAKGGVSGSQLVVIPEDGQCDGISAASAAQKLISTNKVSIIIGGACSGETLAMAPIAEQAKVLLVSPGASAAAISDAGDYVFRVSVSDTLSSQKLADIISGHKHRSVAVISEQTEYAQGLGSGFIKNITQKGVEVISNESYNSDTRDFKSLALKVASKKPDAIFINPQTGANGYRLVKALRDMGSTAEMYAYFISGDDFVTPDGVTEGVYILDVGSVSNDQLAQDFNSAFMQKFGHKPGYAAYGTLTYDTTKIILNALRESGNTADVLRDYLYTMKPYTGIAGNLTFDKNGDALGLDLYALRRVKDGKLEVVE
jgi:branched-chain amino acid transport system substrate-binding protein